MTDAATAMKNLTQVDADTLGIEWADGKQCRYGVRDLRLACTCAACVNEWTGEKLVEEAKIPQDVRPEALETVGLYGLRIQWSDGHSTGIYTFEHLRGLCADD